MTSRDPAISAVDVTVRYQETLALDRVTVTLPIGTITALVGINGSGKSTLFKSLLGLVRPTSGTVRLLGRAPVEACRNGLVAYVPQAEAVDWAFPISVFDVVMTGRYGRLGFLRRYRRGDIAAVREALRRVDLEDLANRQIGALSGGQRKRVFIARALAQDARVLLLDEPFAGVDKGSEGLIVNLLHELRDEGRAVFVSTHDLAGLSQLCDDVVLLHRRVLAHGRPADVMTPENLAQAFGLGLDENAHPPVDAVQVSQ